MQDQDQAVKMKKGLVIESPQYSNLVFSMDPDSFWLNNNLLDTQALG